MFQKQNSVDLSRYYRVLTMVYNTQRLLFRKNPDDGQSPKTQYLSVDLVRKLTIPTERPPLVAE
jgi:hypothetical protein